MMLLICYILYFLSILWPVQGSKDEERLYQALLANYSSLVRPVDNPSQTLKVKIRLYLRQILDVNAKKQTAQVQVWLRLIWIDRKLQWNPAQHAGIKNVRFLGDEKQIWRPDILLYNRVDDSFDWLYKSNTIVQHTGEVLWTVPAILKFTCKLDVTWFPFDDQLCKLKFGSWTHNDWQLHLQMDPPESTGEQMDLSDYVESGEWKLYKTLAESTVRYFLCCREPYQTVTFALHMGRRTLYYGFNLIIPSFLISLMTILGFTLPPNSCEKATLGMFFLCCMMVVTASVVFTILILNLHFRSPKTHTMSPILRQVLLVWLPWILLMSRPGKTYVNCGTVQNKTRNRLDDDLDNDSINYEELVRTGTVCPKIQILHRVYMEIRQITQRMAKEDEAELLQADWTYAAMAVDRACLICFSVFITLFLIIVIFTAPHIVL